MESVESLGRLNSDYKKYPINIETVRGLQSDPHRMKTMISDVGKFIASFLSLRHSYHIETHTSKSWRHKIHRVNHGAELHELMTEEAVFCGDSSGSCSGYIMEELDRTRDRIHGITVQHCNFTHEYSDFLGHLERLCSSRPFAKDVVHLKEIVIDDETNFPTCEVVVAGYFSSIDLQCAARGVVELGNFATAVSVILEDKVDAWLTDLQTSVEQSHSDCKQNGDCTMDDVKLVSFMKASLCRMIATHVSMEGCFDAQSQTLKKVLTSSNFEDLATQTLKLFEPRFEEIKKKRRHEMCLVQTFCTCTDANTLMVCSKQHTRSLISGLRTISWLSSFSQSGKRKLEGGSSSSSDNNDSTCGDVDVHVDSIIGILQTFRGHGTHTGSCNVVGAVQIKDWQATCGSNVLKTICSFCAEHLTFLDDVFKLPSVGFIATLRSTATIPLPRWVALRCSHSELRACKQSLPHNLSKKADMSRSLLPANFMSAFRLLSIVWEMSANTTTYDAFFNQGCVFARLAKQVVSMHQVPSCLAFTILRMQLQQLSVGENYRNAIKHIRNFNGSTFENEIRIATRLISRWSVEELMTVCCEESPLFHSSLYKILDSTLSNMVIRPASQSSGLVVRALLTARPILHQIRSEARISISCASSPVVDTLWSIPAVRKWPGNSDELLLTHADVVEGITGSADILKDLSRSRTLVHYCRRGSKNVYILNGHDLRKLLR